MNISESDEFKKDFKKLRKKYRTLDSDFETAKRVIATEPTGDGTKHWNILWQKESMSVMKVRMMCRAIKGASFRIIYFYDGEKADMLFIEMYFKGNKVKEDRQRIEDLIKEIEEFRDK
jgi:hypothetical protein